MTYPSRILMGPGPSSVNPKVLEALSVAPAGYLDPEFIALLDDLRQKVKYLFQTQNEYSFVLPTPATGAMETCFANLVEQGDQVLIIRNGFFGFRMSEMAARYGANLHILDFEWGTDINIEVAEEKIKSISNLKIVGFVQGETSTGVYSNAQSLCKIIQEAGAISIVDAVTSAVGTPLKVDEWGIDAVYTGSQKCLSSVAGVSPISFSEKAMEKIKNRKTKVPVFFLDVMEHYKYWAGEKRTYHHTAPINSYYALHQSLEQLQHFGLEYSWKRHRENQSYLLEKLKSLNLKLFVDEKISLPQLNPIKVPEGVNEADVRKFLLEKYNLELGAGLGSFGGKIWRVGLMGYSSSKENIDLLVKGLKEFGI